MSQMPPRDAQASAASHAPSANLKRRRFLLALGAGSAGAATVAAQPLAAQLPAAAAAPADSAQGYRESEHVRDYYATTRT
jgi:hypothetical protein